MPFLPTNRKRKPALLFNAYGEPGLQGRSFENCEWLAHSFYLLLNRKIYIYVYIVQQYLQFLNKTQIFNY